MTDPILQDLNNLTSEGLVQILSNKKKAMLDEQRVPAKKRAVNQLSVSAFAGLGTKLRKARGKKCTKSNRDGESFANSANHSSTRNEEAGASN
jgi:hypothetical protein